jgi:hypothetical protein
VADERQVNDVLVYKDSAGFYRERPVEASSGNSTAPSGTPAVTQTYGMDSAADGLNPTVVSTTPIVLMSLDAYNARNGGVRVALYDRSTPPTLTDTPKWTVYLPGLVAGGREWPTGLRFDVGLAFMLMPDDATGLMAGDILSLNLGYSS